MTSALLNSVPRVDEPDPPQDAGRSGPAAPAAVATLPLGQGPVRTVPAVLPRNEDAVLEEFVARFRHFGVEPDGELGSAIAQLARAWGAAQRAEAEVWARPSPLESDLARQLRVEGRVRRPLAEALARAEATLEAIRKRPDPVAAEVERRTPTDPVAEMRASEARSYLRGLDEAGRRRALEDPVMLKAAVSGPAVLSGLRVTEHEELRERLAGPDAVAAARAREVTVRQLEFAIEQYRRWVASGFPPPRPPAA